MKNVFEKFDHFSNSSGPLLEIEKFNKEKQNWLDTLDENAALQILNWVENPFELRLLSGVRPEFLLEARYNGILYATEAGERLHSDAIRIKIESLYIDKDIQYGVLQGIQKLKSYKSLPFLSGAISFEDDENLSEIIFSIGEIGGKEAKNLLMWISSELESPSPDVQSNLNEALLKASG